MLQLLVDSHCHVQFQAYAQDRDEVIKRALDENVWMINVGTRLDTSKAAVELAKKYHSGVFATVGIHPIHAVKSDFKDKEELPPEAPIDEKVNWHVFEELARDSKVAAIGETGLDYWRIEQNLPEDVKDAKEKQKEIFLQQLEIAKRLGKPVVIHCRAAYDDLYEILREMKGNEKEGRELRGAVHFFTGSLQDAKRFLELGFYIAFPGIITYARDYDKVIKYAPLDRILVETDAPYAAPEPFRGQRNEPRYVKYVAEKLAELKGLTSEEIVEVTTANAKTLFQI